MPRIEAVREPDQKILFISTKSIVATLARGHFPLLRIRKSVAGIPRSCDHVIDRYLVRFHRLKTVNGNLLRRHLSIVAAIGAGPRLKKKWDAWVGRSTARRRNRRSANGPPRRRIDHKLEL